MSFKTFSNEYIQEGSQAKSQREYIVKNKPWRATKTNIRDEQQIIDPEEQGWNNIR